MNLHFIIKGVGVLAVSNNFHYKKINPESENLRQ